MKKKILIILLILIFIYCIGGVIYSIIINQKTKGKEADNNILTINNYDYQIDDSVTTLYKNEFNSLKSNLESKDIDYNNYASSIAKLYIIDLYTLSIKRNKYDVTSSQYIYSSVIENYKLKVSDTLYNFIEDNCDERNQELPEVSEVIIENVEESTYLIDSKEYDSYVITLSWLYKKDLGYDTEAVLTLINKDGIISVIEEKRLEKNS